MLRLSMETTLPLRGQFSRAVDILKQKAVTGANFASKAVAAGLGERTVRWPNDRAS